MINSDGRMNYREAVFGLRLLDFLDWMNNYGI